MLVLKDKLARSQRGCLQGLQFGGLFGKLTGYAPSAFFAALHQVEEIAQLHVWTRCA